MLIFRDSGKVFESKGGFLKMIIIKNSNVELASFSDKEKLFEFAKETNFDLKAQNIKSTRDGTLIKLLNSTAINASGISTIVLSSDLNEFCDRLKLLLQQTQAGNKSDTFNHKNFAIVDKLLEYKCLSKKKHKKRSIKCILLHK